MTCCFQMSSFWSNIFADLTKNKEKNSGSAPVLSNLIKVKFENKIKLKSPSSPHLPPLKPCYSLDKNSL